jgi:hypothetical protein
VINHKKAIFSVATFLDPRFKVRCFSTEVTAAQAKVSLLLAAKRFVEVIEPSLSDKDLSISEPWTTPLVRETTDKEFMSKGKREIFSRKNLIGKTNAIL